MPTPVTFQLANITVTDPFECTLNVDNPNGWVSGLVIQAEDGTYLRTAVRSGSVQHIWPNPVIVPGGGGTPTDPSADPKSLTQDDVSNMVYLTPQTPQQSTTSYKLVTS